jgi:putative membrane protein
MMHWGTGMGGWGVLMALSSLLFWALVVAGIVVVVGYLGHATRTNRSATEPATPHQILAARFARGEIDEDEYRCRLQVLDGAPAARRPGG